VAAAIYETTGRIEWGKCPTLVAWAAMGLAVFAAGVEWRLRRRYAAAVAFVVALNPVVMSELTSYLVDGIMVGFLTVVVAAVFSGLRRPQPAVVCIGIMAAVVSINAKFTGLVFLCFVFAAGGLWCALRRREWLRAYLGWVVLTLLVGAGVFGYNPYLTNTIHRHHPFYPVLGTAAFPSLTTQGKEGIELYETPKNLMGRSRFVRLGYAIFGRPGNQPYRNERNAQLMWPFTARPADLFYYRYHGTRVAGFGPFFSGALLISLGLAVWMLWQPGVFRWVAALVALTIVSSLLISPHLWWPRYGPQLWLLPIVPVVFVFWGACSRWAVGVAWLLVALLVLNAGMVAAVRMAWETKATQTLRWQLIELRQPGREIEIYFPRFEVSGEERLKTWGVRFQKKGRNEIHGATELMSVVEGYPGAVQYRVLPPGAASPPK
jgi:4-amino-4-deoxy-L-arabinose transferase-like glycosyltransferase